MFFKVLMKKFFSFKWEIFEKYWKKRKFRWRNFDEEEVLIKKFWWREKFWLRNFDEVKSFDEKGDDRGIEVKKKG